MKTKNTFSISFFIKKYKLKDDQAPVYARITVDGKSLDLSAKRKVYLRNWDEAKGSVKGSKQEVKALAAYFDQIRNRLYECHQELEKERRLITAEAIKQRYLGEDESGRSLQELMTYHNEEMKHELAPGTQKNYYTTQKYVQAFLKEKCKTSDMYLEELNYKFIKDFEKFLKNHKPKDHHRHLCTRTAFLPGKLKGISYSVWRLFAVKGSAVLWHKAWKAVILLILQ